MGNVKKTKEMMDLKHKIRALMSAKLYQEAESIQIEIEILEARETQKMEDEVRI